MTSIFQGYDGEIRLIENGLSGATYYLQILFCEMDFNGPLSRGYNEETLILDRGRFDANAHYVQGDDQPRYAPYPFSFSCRLADTVNTVALSDFVSGATNAVGGTTVVLHTWSGKTNIDGVAAPTFNDPKKMRYRVEVLWDNPSATNYGLRYEEVYFPPDQQTIAESEDSLMLNINGQIMGDVTRITAFSSGYIAIS